MPRQVLHVPPSLLTFHTTTFLFESYLGITLNPCKHCGHSVAKCVCLDCRDVQPEETYFDRDVEKAFMKASADLFERKTKCSLLLSNQNGNMYTPSVYGCLASLIAQYVSLSDFHFIH